VKTKAILILVVVVIIAIVGWLLINKSNKNNIPTVVENQKTPTIKTVEGSDVSPLGISLELPTGYKITSSETIEDSGIQTTVTVLAPNQKPYRLTLESADFKNPLSSSSLKNLADCITSTTEPFLVKICNQKTVYGRPLIENWIFDAPECSPGSFMQYVYKNPQTLSKYAYAGVIVDLADLSEKQNKKYPNFCIDDQEQSAEQQEYQTLFTTENSLSSTEREDRKIATIILSSITFK